MKLTEMFIFSKHFFFYYLFETLSIGARIPYKSNPICNSAESVNVGKLRSEAEYPDSESDKMHSEVGQTRGNWNSERRDG